MDELEKTDFYDLGANCAGFLITRAKHERVAFAVSLETNGDIDVCVSASDARSIGQALVAAADHAEGKPNAD
jgi:hypothetical protein